MDSPTSSTRKPIIEVLQMSISERRPLAASLEGVRRVVPGSVAARLAAGDGPVPGAGAVLRAVLMRMEFIALRGSNPRASDPP